eukprot:3191295-Rhodomonas_salina.3
MVEPASVNQLALVRCQVTKEVLLEAPAAPKPLHLLLGRLYPERGKALMSQRLFVALWVWFKDADVLVLGRQCAVCCPKRPCSQHRSDPRLTRKC